MGMFGENWNLSWGFAQVSAADVDETAIANSASLTTDPISNDEKLNTEVSIEIAYGGTANEGVRVFILRDVDGTEYEGAADAPWGFAMPHATSVTRRRTFTVPASIGRFRVLLTNESGAEVDASVRYRQSEGVTAA